MTESYTYDEFGRTVQSTSNDGTVQNYTYDADSNVTSYTMTKDGEVKNSSTYEYNTADLLTKLTNGDNILTYEYDNNGNLKTAKNNGTTETTMSYNKANLLTSKRNTYGGKTYDYSMYYNYAGQKFMELDTANSSSKYYDYTPLGQLEREWEQSGTTTLYNTTYSYDSSGNRTQMNHTDYSTRDMPVFVHFG